MSFAALGLPEPIVRSLRAVGYSEPTPIQAKAIPLILPGHDVVAAAQTGSGKTAAFLLPILARLMEGHTALRALVLVPTRELAAQVEAAGRKYARHCGLEVGAVYGGVPIGPQERMIRNDGVDILIATPGRLLDLQGRQSVSLDEIEVLVLDEADRMVDMGFAPDLRRILNLLPKKRQTLMFSATMPTELNKVAAEALVHPKRLEISSPTSTVPSVTQTFVQVGRPRKFEALEAILGSTGDREGISIVFARTKRGAERLGKSLEQRGYRVAILHGDRSQGQRERALRDFRRGRARILVATDIASRGIDVTGVARVINYDVPLAPEDYIHRIGRTGRMNATGEAITLVSPEEHSEAAAIERTLGRKIERRALPGISRSGAAEDHAPRGRSHAAASHAPAGRAHPAPSRGEGRPAPARRDGYAPSRPERPSRSEQPSRSEHAPRTERPHRSEQPARPEYGPRTERPHRTEHTSRADHAPRAGEAGAGRHAQAAQGGRESQPAPRPDRPAAEHGRRPQRNVADRRGRRRI